MDQSSENQRSLSSGRPWRIAVAVVVATFGVLPATSMAQKTALPTGPEVTPTLSLNFGSETEDAVASFAIDPKNGNMWVAGMQKSLVDKFTYDWFVAQLSPTGVKKWMRVLGSTIADESTIKHIDMGGEGNPRMLALVPDGSGAIVVGRSEAGPDGKTPTGVVKAPHAAVIFKVKQDGSLAWSKAFRPGWENKMIQSAGFTNVVVVDKRAYAVGSTNGEASALIAVFDTDTGAMLSAQGYDFGPTYNDRFFGVAADKAKAALWISGWSGSGNKGIVAKFSLADQPVLAWSKRVPNGWGSPLPDISLDAAGNAYLASEVHGATTVIEAWRIAPDATVAWRAKYNTGTTGPTCNTHAIHVFGNKLVILGRVGYSGTQTHSDPKFGDSLVLVTDLDAKLLKDMYHFTGTAGDIVAMERSRGAALYKGTLYVAGNIWSEGASYKGQWRKPVDYKIAGTIVKDVPVLEDVKPPVENQSAAVVKDPTWLTWTDTSASFTSGTPTEMSYKVQRSTQGYIYGFKDFLK